MDNMRAAPNNQEAEGFVVATLLIDPAKMDEVWFLSPDQFYNPKYRQVFGVMSELHQAGTPCDAPAVIAATRGKMDPNDLIPMLQPKMNTRYLKKQADYIVEAAQRRRLIQSAVAIMEIGYDSSLPLAEAIDSAESEVFRVRDGQKGVQEAISLKQVHKELVKEIAERMRGRKSTTAISTGIEALDDLTGGGIHCGDLVIIAGRPGMGKTALAVNMASNQASEGKSILFFSMEMSAMQLDERLTVADSKVHAQKLRAGNISDEDCGRLTASMGRTHDYAFYIDRAHSVSAMDIRAKARRHKRLHGLDAIYIDYLGLMRKPRADNEALALGEISRSLKELAMDLKIPVVLLAQLNRGCESRPDKRPMPSDLKGSGDIEQDADMILFCYRDAVYCPKCKMGSGCDIVGHKGLAEIIAAKQRHGETGTAELMWRGELTSFFDFPNPSNG